MISTGIDKLTFYTPAHFIDLSTLAKRDNIDPAKYQTGIGQDAFSVASHDEDIVTMAANAAATLLKDEDTSNIDTLIMATESSIDQSKAAAIYVQQLLNLPKNIRAIELKQACYSATAGLQFACAYTAAYPEKKVLLIASDIARYDLHTPAEATQGAAAVAMLISANPRTAILNPFSGLYTEDVMDFWRPNHRNTPLVDGKLSTQIYLKAAENAWKDYINKGGIAFSELAQHCYHLPFTKMGLKAHQKLARSANIEADLSTFINSTYYNRLIGNSYTASLYLSLISALDYRDDLAGCHIGMMSYGSGCVAEYYTLQITENYQQYRYQKHHQTLLQRREPLTLSAYENYWHRPEYQVSEHILITPHTKGEYRLVEIQRHERQYQCCK